MELTKNKVTSGNSFTKLSISDTMIKMSNEKKCFRIPEIKTKSVFNHFEMSINLVGFMALMVMNGIPINAK